MHRDVGAVRSRGTPAAPSGLIRLGKLTQGKPWAKLFWPLRAIGGILCLGNPE